MKTKKPATVRENNAPYRAGTTPGFHAVLKRDSKWWIGWIEEIAGVNSQGKTRAELLANLQSALQEALIET